jgi:hypothetical protein
MVHSSETGAGAGDGAYFALSMTDRRALWLIRLAGRAGATAKQIGFHSLEDAGLKTGLRLLRRGLVVATPDNRFVLAKYAKEYRAGTVVADERGRAGFIGHVRRAPLVRAKSKPAPVDVTGMMITKLPPGEAVGARDLQRWRKVKR